MTTITTLQIEGFKKLFSGAQYSWGQFIPSEAKPTGKKLKKEGVYRTEKRMVTLEEYRDHLEGRKGLGIVPINESGMCKFAVIDIDIYGKDLSMYVRAIERGNFPIVPFLSKSGGLHLYTFFKEETPAGKAVDIMRKLSAILSIDTLVKEELKGTVEIFPKQVKLNEGESGSFINLPYFDVKVDQRRAILNGRSLTLDEMLVRAVSKSTTVPAIEEFLRDLEFTDAPPCLQQCYLLDPFTEPGMHRNNFLFSFGVYLKKKDDYMFEQKLYDVNATLSRPLEDKELERTILSSIRNKDYMYKCKETPCADFCNKKECKKREYGIGKDDGYFSSVECGKLFKFDLDQPYYEWEVRRQGQEQYTKLHFNSEDEIIRQDAFLRLCMRELYELPPKVKQNVWTDQVNQALREIEIVRVDPSDDTSPYQMFVELVTEFVTGQGQAMAETKEQIKLRRPYFDKALEEYIFRGADLQNYVYTVKGFRDFKPNQYHKLYRQLGCVAKQARITPSENVRVWSLTKEKLSNLGKEVDFESIKTDFSKFVEEDY